MYHREKPDTQGMDQQNDKEPVPIRANVSTCVLYKKDCRLYIPKQKPIANLVCDICLVFRNFMIAFNLDLDFLKHLLFLLYNCAKLFCYQVEYFYMWILEGEGWNGCIHECLNLYLHAMQCSMKITECQSWIFVCLLDVTVICVYM